MSVQVKTFVDSAISDNTVTVFSKSWCPYCTKAKALLSSKFPNVKLTVYELDEREDGNVIQQYLLAKSGQRTVPNIFIKGQHIGGNDDLTAAEKKGDLKVLLA